MRTRQGSRAGGDGPRRDHHEWASETYVDEWVKRQQAEDPSRVERFQLICDLFPFPNDATVTILDVGAGYGPVACSFSTGILAAPFATLAKSFGLYGDGPIVSPEEIRSALERSLKVVKEGKLALIDTVTQPR
jgi:hypothetical protein